MTRRAVALVAGGLLAGAFVAWCIVFAPPPMDEFTPLHRLACLYPYARLHVFRESCSAYPIEFGVFSYYRPYMYVGVATGWLYFPIWRIWNSPYSYELLGAACLVLFACGMTRALRLPVRYGLLGVLYFPIAYTFIHDTGPVKIALLSIPALGLLAQEAMRERRRDWQCAYGAAGGAIVAVAVEDKPFYLWLLPLVVLCVCAFVEAANDEQLPPLAILRQLRLALLYCVAVAGTAVGVLMFVGRVQDSGYTRLLYGREVPATTYFYGLARVSKYLPGSALGQVKNLFYYTVEFPWNASIVFGVGQRSAVLFAVLLAALLWAIRRSIRPRDWLILASAFAVCAGVFVVTRTSWANHHYVYLHVPLLALLLVAAGRGPARSRLAVCAYVAGTCVLTVAMLTASPIDERSSRERVRLFAYLSRPDVASSHVINFSTGGAYPQQALYGDRSQLVTYTEPLNTADASRLLAVARGLSRSIVDACVDCSRESVAAFFPGTPVTELDLGLQQWKVFRIETR